MAALEQDLEALTGLGVEKLRALWRERLGQAPPPIRSGDILRRALAERLQQAVFGVDPALERDLINLARRHRPGKRLAATGPNLAPGAQLLREWGGQRHCVEVAAEGFIWNGATYDSLSQIATLITGTRWNGPRFFGLRSQARS